MSARLLILLMATASLGIVAVGQNHTQVPAIVYDYACSDTSYTAGSQYEKNLNDLVSTLATTAAANGNGWFHSGSVGAAPLDQTWGLIMCYAEWNVTQCLGCLRNASAGDLRGLCPYNRDMSVNYGGCLLRYADVPFLGTAATDGFLVSWTPANGGAADIAIMSQARWRLLNQLALSAGDEPLRFSNGSLAYADARGAPQVVYALAQCTRDLRPGECSRCLMGQIVQVARDMRNSTDGSVRGFSCHVMYQVNDPIDIIAGLVPAAPVPVPSPSPQPSGAVPPPGSKLKGSKTPLIATWAAVVALMAAGV